ncbi:MAG: hypothetical protein Fur0032_20930 [Terrimicrobiaceae bacterium]
MSTHLANAGPVLPFTPTADQTNSRGLFVENSSGNAAIVNAATDVPIGVIADGSPTTGKSAIAMSGTGAIAKVKCAATAGTINPGTYLTLDGTTLGAVAADPGTGNRVRVARACEAGANNALIDAVLIDPVVLS